MTAWSRRQFLGTSAGAAAMALAGTMPRGPISANEAARTLRVDTRTIDVLGRAATVFGIFDDPAYPAFHFPMDQRFRVRLENRLGEPTLLHWHGLTPPWMQDGVPDLPHPPIGPGTSHEFDFALGRAGTYWMHSHLGLQQQSMLAAPLIVTDPADNGLDRQEIVLMLQDFSFRPAAEILAALGPDMPAAQAMDHGSAMAGDHDMHDMAAMPDMPAHANDFDHDAYLANERTLADPQVVTVERDGLVRLRIINAAASTNFHIDSGALAATLVAVDGLNVLPIERRLIPVAMGQRIDLDLRIPGDGGTYPILARREGATDLTGIVLATSGAAIAKLAMQADRATPLLDLALEQQLAAESPPPVRPADRRLDVVLAGNHHPYKWAIAITDRSAHHPVEIGEGERVEIAMTNRSAMPHPMHLHGHSFQVVDLGAGRFAGAQRDTVQVPPGKTVTIVFDADNPGRWAFHCHHLYHLAAGMMATLDYRGFV